MGAGLCASLSLFSLACVTEDADPTATGGTAGSPVGGAGTSAAGTSSGGGTGGTTGGGGSAGGAATGIRNDPAFGMGTQCPAVTTALITDFTYVPPAPVGDAGAGDAGTAPAPIPANISFGDYATTLSGYTYTYPNAAADPTDPYAVNSDISTGEWHLTGSIGNYSGLVLDFANCNQVDASAYAGISFTIRGNVAMGNTMTLNVATAEDDISHLWLNANAMPPPNPPAVPNFGTCIPAMAQYDGSCGSPSFTVPVTPTETTIEVRWDEFTLGRPRPDVDPASVTAIRWIFPPPPGAGTATPTPYAAELFIDDLQFIEP
jgi:hypothetical protein